MEAGIGIYKPPKTVAFQVAISPPEETRGKGAEIIGPVKISGKDVWTGEIIEAQGNGKNTLLLDDPTLRQEDGIVQ